MQQVCTESPPGVSYELENCIVIHRPTWFTRQDFQDWRNGAGTPAMWYPRNPYTPVDPRPEAHEYDDVFVLFSEVYIPRGIGAIDSPSWMNEHDVGWTGSEGDPPMPVDIARDIWQILAKAGLYSGVLWIKAV